MANGVIGKVTAGGGTHLIASTAFAICETAAATAAKKAYIKDGDGNDASFTLYKGVTVLVKMTNENSARDPMLNVNGTGDKLIVRDNETAHMGWNTYYSWKAGSVISFTYDGTNWMISGEPKRAEVMSRLESMLTNPYFLNGKDYVEAAHANNTTIFLYEKMISFTTNGNGKCLGFSVPDVPSSSSTTSVSFYPISFIRTNTGIDSESYDFVVSCYIRYNEQANKVNFYVYDPVDNVLAANKTIEGILTGLLRFTTYE